MINVIISSLFYLIPSLTVIFWVVSLIFYLDAKSQNKKQPGSVDARTLDRRRFMLMLSSVFMVLFLMIVVGFIALMYMAVAFM